MKVISKRLPQLSESILDRFLSKIAYTANINNCWDWMGGISRGGYGNFGVRINNATKNIICTRLSYFIHNNKDPYGFAVLHKCDNRKCVNPNHLYLGSNKDNSEDMVQKNRQASGVNNGSSKLSEQQVIEIRKEYVFRTVSFQKLANKFNLAKATVKSIIKRETWKHI